MKSERFEELLENLADRKIVFAILVPNVTNLKHTFIFVKLFETLLFNIEKVGTKLLIFDQFSHICLD